MSAKINLKLDYDNCLEVYNIGKKIFHPLDGFMDSKDYKSVVNNMHLDNGVPWTIPISLDIPEDLVADAIKSKTINLVSPNNVNIAELIVEDVFKVNFDEDIIKIYGTDDVKHPGVSRELSRSKYRVGGTINVFEYEKEDFLEYSLSPMQTKKIFEEKKWKTIVGFQTRNPIHRAHEYLQRVALEMVDGLFIHPLIGWKKSDDFSPIAVVKSYIKMVNEFYPKNRALLGVLKTPMRYAGPREAVFHSIVRKNFGCTHFIIGRDHAGVGSYYGKYDAHKLSKEFNDLGINILCLSGPYHCSKCDGIVTEKTCPHGDAYSNSISGTQVRALFKSGKVPPLIYMREEISSVLLSLSKENKLFCGEINE